MFRLLIVLFGVLIINTSLAHSGTFTLTETDTSGYWYEYTGTVLPSDVDNLREIMDRANGEYVFIVINSGGGYAYTGIDLYYEAEKWDNLVTIAGRDFGAWSAAAVFWLGSPHDFHQGKEAKIGFHVAYCNAWVPPGCDTSDFQKELIRVFDRCGWYGSLFNHYLNRAQAQGGVSSWILLTDEGWFFHHSREGLTWKIPCDWVRKA